MSEKNQRTSSNKIVSAPAGQKIMVVTAHPDDLESWCAGTLVQAIEHGATVRALLVTSGDKGSNNPADTPLAVANRREQETLAAAKIFGLAEVQFLRYEDGEVENTRELRRELVEWIRRWRPDIVFTHDPEQPLPPYLCHRDHRTVGRATLDAIYPLARDYLTFSEHLGMGLMPHAVKQVWLFASNNPSAVGVNISDGLDRKIEARLAHVSQTVSAEKLRQNWQTRAANIGAEFGLPFAETFTILNL